MFVVLNTDIIAHSRLRFLSRPYILREMQIIDQSWENIKTHIYKYLEWPIDKQNGHLPFLRTGGDKKMSILIFKKHGLILNSKQVFGVAGQQLINWREER